MPITVLDLVMFRDPTIKDDGPITLGRVEATGLPFFGGCQCCGASIVAYNACPSKSGYLKCASGCIGDTGYETCDEANRAMFQEEYAWQGPAKPDEDNDNNEGG